jgi:hypothetical protein
MYLADQRRQPLHRDVIVGDVSRYDLRGPI